MNEPTQQDIEVVTRAVESVLECRGNSIQAELVAKASIQALQSLGYVKLDDLIEEAEKEANKGMPMGAVVIAIIFAITVTALTTNAFTIKSIERDCEKLGMFRNGGVVYTCSKKQ